MIVPIIGESCHKYNFCRDKCFVATKVCLSRQTRVGRDKHTFVATNICREKHNFVPTKPCNGKLTCLSRQNTSFVSTKIFCRDKNNFVAIKVLSRQAYFCRDERRVLSRQTRVCRDKTVVATKMILVAAPASDIFAYCLRPRGSLREGRNLGTRPEDK